MDRPRRFTLADVPPVAITLVTFVMTWVLFRFFMTPFGVQVNFDEGCEAAAVERVLSGRGLPYVDAFAIRGLQYKPRPDGKDTGERRPIGPGGNPSR